MKDLRELQIEAMVDVMKKTLHAQPFNALYDGMFWNLEAYAKYLLSKVEEAETEYHNKWEEMRLEEQYQEKPE